MPCYCSDTGFCNYLGITVTTPLWNACQRWPDSQRDKLANDLNKKESNRDPIQKDKIKFCLHNVDYSRAAFEIDGIFLNWNKQNTLQMNHTCSQLLIQNLQLVILKTKSVELL